MVFLGSRVVWGGLELRGWKGILISQLQYCLKFQVSTLVRQFWVGLVLFLVFFFVFFSSKFCYVFITIKARKVT